jgi:hypothetical protein
MGLMDFLKGSRAKKRCASCKVENVELPISKKFDGTVHLFCCKDCERQFRIDRKKAAKKPQTLGTSSPWG